MKTVFITGGRGFIGKNLTEKLTAAGYRVLAPSSSELNLLDEQAVDEFMRRQPVDIIIHAANKGGGRDTMGMADVVQMNLRMFFNIAKHACEVEKMIHFGSGAEYGKHKPIIMASEDDADNALPLDDYGFYKAVCSRYIQRLDGNIINLRIFGCYGKYEDYRFKFISNAIVKNLLGLPIVIRQNVFFDYIYIDDLIRMVVWAMNNETLHKVYNISNGTRIDLLTLVELINGIASIPSAIEVDNPGLNLEYTSSNERILKELTVEFTGHGQAINELYAYYVDNLDSLDLDTVREDVYINKIAVLKKDV
jgi:GDP-L-fucose synthase